MWQGSMAGHRLSTQAQPYTMAAATVPSSSVTLLDICQVCIASITFSKGLFILFHVYECVFCLHVYMYQMHAWYSWKPEENIRSHGTGVTDGSEPLRRCCELSPGLL